MVTEAGMGAPPLTTAIPRPSLGTFVASAGRQAADYPVTASQIANFPVPLQGHNA